MVFVATKEPIDRFNDKFEVDRAGCHVWTASLSKSGYGKFFAEGFTFRAHRWIYEETYGPVPDNLQVDHICNNRACVNIRHLRAVTPRENVTATHSKASARLNLDKERCPRGHLLAVWNLNQSSISRQERSCKSCNLARSRNRYSGRPAGWWIEEADRLYAKLEAM